MSARKLILPALLALSALLLSACLFEQSPAPGCRATFGLGTGGCQGKSAVINLRAYGADCLTLEADNCNGGVINVRNNCKDDFLISSINIKAGSSAILDLQEENMFVKLAEVDNNFSQYIPKAETTVEMYGTVGANTIRMRFTKTGPLCK